MRVAVITLHRIHNYGSVLQAYATQRIFEAMGHDTVIVDYITPQRTRRKLYTLRPAGSSGGFKGMLIHGARIASLIIRDITFGHFRERYMKLTGKYVTPEDLEKNPPVADLYVSGSDQVWNSHYNEGVDRGFFLDFISEDCRRLAFVSSFGKTSLDDSEKHQIRKYLDRYQALSVREDSALEIIRDLGRQDAVHLLDPTLQLSREEWMKIASPRLVHEPYVLLMLLYNEDNHATEYARKIADAKGLKLVRLSWGLKKPAGVDVLMTHRSPQDFISLFANADFIVTNSFHGLAFSINLEKQFIVVPRNEFNSRIESLLRLTGLSGRMIRGQDCLVTAREYIDYTSVRKILEAEREKARAFLTRYVGLEKQ